MKKYVLNIHSGLKKSFDLLSKIDRGIFINFMDSFNLNAKKIIKESKILTNKDSHDIYTYPISEKIRVLFTIDEDQIIILDVMDLSRDKEFKYITHNSFDELKAKNYKWSFHELIGYIIRGVLFGMLFLGLVATLIPSQKNNIENPSGDTLSQDGNVVTIPNTGSKVNTIQIFSGSLSLRGYSQNDLNTMSMFPKIQIGTGDIEQVTLKITVNFNKDYQRDFPGKIYGYKSDGSPAKGFVYALRIAIGDIRNGGYFDTTRIFTDEVKSDPDNGLFGATQGSNIIGGKVYEINLGDFKIANKIGYVGYSTQNYLSYLNSMKGKTIPIGAYLSDAIGTEIKSIEIEYVGDGNMFLPTE